MSAERAIVSEAAAGQSTERVGHSRELLRRRDLALDAAVKVGLALIVTVLAVLYLIPLHWLFVTSIKVPGSLYEAVPDVFPTDVSILSWRRILDHPFVPRWFTNSLIVATAATAGTLL